MNGIYEEESKKDLEAGTRSKSEDSNSNTSAECRKPRPRNKGKVCVTVIVVVMAALGLLGTIVYFSVGALTAEEPQEADAAGTTQDSTGESEQLQGGNNDNGQGGDGTFTPAIGPETGGGNDNRLRGGPNPMLRGVGPPQGSDDGGVGLPQGSDNGEMPGPGGNEDNETADNIGLPIPSGPGFGAGTLLREMPGPGGNEDNEPADDIGPDSSFNLPPAVNMGVPIPSGPEAGAGSLLRGVPIPSGPEAGAGTFLRGVPIPSGPEAGAGTLLRGVPIPSGPEAGAGTLLRVMPGPGRNEDDEQADNIADEANDGMHVPFGLPMDPMESHWETPVPMDLPMGPMMNPMSMEVPMEAPARNINLMLRGGPARPRPTAAEEDTEPVETFVDPTTGFNSGPVGMFAEVPEDNLTELAPVEPFQSHMSLRGIHRSMPIDLQPEAEETNTDMETQDAVESGIEDTGNEMADGIL